jgi:hypothetical protein
MMDWFPAVMTLVGVLVGVGVQEFRIWREREDKYKDMVFEKRLEVHQGAHYWCMALGRLMAPHRLMQKGGIEVAFKKSQEADEWLAKNELYLDNDSDLKMTEFLRYVDETCLRYSQGISGGKKIDVAGETRKLIDITVGLSASIRKGIGGKYLPEQSISIENVEVEKGLDEVVEATEEFIKRHKL